MVKTFIRLNQIKTEVLILGHADNSTSIKLLWSNLKSHAKNLGVIFDSGPIG